LATRSKSAHRNGNVPSARKRRSGRRRLLRNWVYRVGRGLVPLAVLTVTGFVAYPFFLQLRLGGEYGARVSEARHKLETLRRQNSSLQRDIRDLQSRVGLEKALRDEGYGRAGEVRVKVHTASVRGKDPASQ